MGCLFIAFHRSDSRARNLPNGQPYLMGLTAADGPAVACQRLLYPVTGGISGNASNRSFASGPWLTTKAMHNHPRLVMLSALADTPAAKKTLAQGREPLRQALSR